jgi:hypothetical protein
VGAQHFTVNVEEVRDAHDEKPAGRANGTCCVLPNTHVGTGDTTATQLEIIDSPRC